MVEKEITLKCGCLGIMLVFSALSLEDHECITLILTEDLLTLGTVERFRHMSNQRFPKQRRCKIFVTYTGDFWNI